MVNDYIRIAGSAGTIERLEAAVTELVDNQTNAVAPATLRAAINSLEVQTAGAWMPPSQNRCRECGGSGYISERLGVRYQANSLKLESLTVFGFTARRDVEDAARAAVERGEVENLIDRARPCGCRT